MNMENTKPSNKIWEGIRNLNQKHPEIFVFAFMTIGVLFLFSVISGRNKKDIIILESCYAEADLEIQSRLKESTRLDSINLCKNLKTLYNYTNSLKQSKLYLATRYQKYLLICFTIGTFFVVLTAVVAFVVTKRGWDNSSRRRKALLLSCAFYGLLLSTFPKLFDQDKNYRVNFSDYTELTKTQIYIFMRLSPYLGKTDNLLTHQDSTILMNALDTASTAIMEHANIDISLDKSQLDAKSIDFQ